ncbi:DNA repair protein RecN [uncultured Tessaracoccus sp.]|uniref:DNA repair protein RecN n=1 Tax=uncultured Tessaracoccus sp. TaxID=905023 RepID=UPI00263898C4|nr:DNA repair protein RecN [uncultured Tessaracoccus sp.]
MLEELTLTDFGVVQHTQLDLRPGLIAVTGETGAGKTMIVHGIGQLLGARADSGVVRRGASKAIVAGRWQVDPPTSEAVAELGAELDGNELVTVRQLSAAGRSRAVVGGSPVPVSTLARLELATIHGQSEQLRLGAPERQRELLDAHANPDGLVRYREAYREHEAVAAELEELESAALERAREADMLRYGLEEIGAANPVAGEDAALEAEQAKLQDLDALRQLAQRASLALSGDEQDFDAPSAVGLLGQGRKALRELAAHDAAASSLHSRAEEAQVLLDDLAANLATYLTDLVDDPLRLEAVAERRAVLAGLTRKYGTTIDEVLAWADNSAQRLHTLDGSDERISKLRRRKEHLEAELVALAKDISETRHGAAESLARQAQAELAALAMPHARLTFQVSDAPLGPHGADKVELLFSANPGSEPAPLAKVASGGELSRVRLALEVVLANAEGHTFVFDEVDAGVGGAVGLEIGRRLQRLAARSQVIVVTHLAQVAAFADQHLVVRKSSDGAVTVSDVAEVRGEERVTELARMMGGSADTEASRRHAAELLQDAARAPQPTAS